MSRNGAGVYTLNTPGQPVVYNTIATDTAFNAAMTDISTALTQSIAVDGQTTTTARIPFVQGISSTLVTDATSATTGSIITAGGISTQKALWVGTTTTLAGALTYGGVTLSNAVTGTGNMVLSSSASLVSPTITGATITTASLNGTVGATTPSTGAFTTLTTSSTVAVSSASASALAVGANGATNPAFSVDATVASQASGIRIVGSNTGGTVAIAATDSGPNTNMTIDAKGSGTLVIAGTSTGAITLARATTITGAATLSSTMTFGGVVFTGATGTAGALPTSVSPTFTGTVGAAAITATGLITGDTIRTSHQYTVATLPAGSVGLRTIVVDALGPVFGNAVAGGGGQVIPVYYDGVWRCG